MDFTANENQKLHFNKNTASKAAVNKSPPKMKQVESKTEANKLKKPAKKKSEPLATKIQCTECPKSYSRVATLNLHIKKYHDQETKYNCNFCEYKSAYKQHFTFHLARHVDVQVMDRAKTFSQKTLLDTTKMEFAVRLTCQLCSKELQSSTKLTKHYAKKHQIVRKFECDHCGWRSIRKENLASHITCKHLINTFYDVYNKERPFKCTFKDCKKRFKVQAVLRQHTTRTHSGTKLTFLKPQKPTKYYFISGIRHACFWCHKSYCKKFDLLNHQKTCLPIKTEVL